MNVEWQEGTYLGVSRAQGDATRRIFVALDRDGTGLLTRKELTRLVYLMGSRMSPQMLREISVSFNLGEQVDLDEALGVIKVIKESDRILNMHKSEETAHHIDSAQVTGYLRPSDTAVLVWNLCVLLAVLYFAFVLSYLYTFPHAAVFFPLHYVASAVLLLDVYVCHQTIAATPEADPWHAVECQAQDPKSVVVKTPGRPGVSVEEGSSESPTSVLSSKASLFGGRWLSSVPSMKPSSPTFGSPVLPLSEAFPRAPSIFGGSKQSLACSVSFVDSPKALSPRARGLQWAKQEHAPAELLTQVLPTLVTHSAPSPSLQALFRILPNRSYLFSWWSVIDIVSALPLDLLALSLTQKYCSSDGHFAFIAAAHLRLLKALRIPGMHTPNSSALVSQTNIPYYLLHVSVLRVVVASAVVVHLLTCVWMRLNHTGSEADPDGGPSTYLHGLYFTLYTLQAVGYGDVPVDTTAKQVFSMVCCVLGVLANAAIVGFLSILVQRTSSEAQASNTMTETTSVLSVYGAIPPKLGEDILSLQYFCTISSLGREKIPESMRTNVELFTRTHFLETVDFLKGVTRECHHTIAASLQKMDLQPDSLLITAHEMVCQMYLVGYGFVEKQIPESGSVSVLSSGGLFGEEVLLAKKRATHSSRTLSYAVVYYLTPADITYVFKVFPHFRAVVKNAMAERGHDESSLDLDFARVRPSMKRQKRPTQGTADTLSPRNRTCLRSASQTPKHAVVDSDDVNSKSTESRPQLLAKRSRRRKRRQSEGLSRQTQEVWVLKSFCTLGFLRCTITIVVKVTTHERLRFILIVFLGMRPTLHRKYIFTQRFLLFFSLTLCFF